jgi:hypothetical protein
VSTNKWIKRLRRECTADPKKAAFLGLLMLVAVYFWAPLAWGWLTAASPTDRVSVPLAQSEVPMMPGHGNLAADSASRQADAPRYPWQELARWRNADPRTVATREPAAGRDPFRLVQTESVEAKKVNEETPSEPRPVWTAETLGLQLSSTIVGPGRSIARISGRTYELGHTLELSRDGSRISLTLSEVGPGRAVLQGQGQSFELTIPDRQPSGRIELLGSRY